MLANRLDTTQPSPKLTANLTRDLMDPGLSALDLCDYHDLKLNQLDELTRSPQFEQLKSCIARVAAARLELIELDAQPRALGSLLETTRLPQEDQKSTETVRKASTRLLPRASGGGARATPSSCLPRPAGEVSCSDGGGFATTSSPTNQPQTHLLPRASGGGARKAGGGGLAQTTSPTNQPTTNPSPPPRVRGQRNMNDNSHDKVVTEGVFPEIHQLPHLSQSLPHLPPTHPFPSAQPPFPARIPGLIASAGLPATFAQTP